MPPALRPLLAWLLPPEEASLQQRLFRALSLTGGLLTLLVVTPANLILGLPPSAHGATVGFGLLALVLARRRRPAAGLLFVAFLALLDVLWFASAGSLGPTGLLFLVAALVGVLFFTGGRRLLALALCLGNGVALLVLEGRTTRWIVPYRDASARTTDIIIGFLLGSLLCAGILWVVLEGYQRERRRLERASEAIRESERRYATTFNHAPAAISIADLETGRFLAANEAFSHLSGFEPHEILGHRAAELGIWAEGGQRDEIIRQLRGGGDVQNRTLVCRRKDGGERWVSYSAELVTMDGRDRLLSMALDITDQRRSEAAIHESEASYRGLFDSVEEAIYIQDRAGAFLDVNQGALRMYGFTREEMIGQTPRLVSAPGRNDFTQVEEALARAFAGTPQAFEFWGLRKNGEIFPKEVRLSRGTYFGRDVLFAVAMDISARKEAEEARQSLEAQLNHMQRMESIGRLAGGISHDMNNVLAAILAASELLKLKDPEHGRHIDMILEASRRGRTLLQNLMAFARKEMEDAELFDLGELVRREADLLANTTLQRVQVQLQLGEGLPRVMGSSAALSTALMNLCVNAVDAMPDGGTLTLRTALLDDAVELVVQDTGQGMAPDVLARAMEPFFTTKPLGKGTGLGLSMVYGTVQAHGGTFEIDSQVGVGTRMRITLPVQAGARFHPLPAGQDAPPQPAPGLRILLVDDDPLVRQTAPELLAAVGHQVTVASGGYEALGLLEHGQGWDLVVLDLNMPGLDGLETLQHLRLFSSELPVCMVTGYADEQLRVRLETFPNVALLAKPYSILEFESAVAGLLQEAAT